MGCGGQGEECFIFVTMDDLRWLGIGMFDLFTLMTRKFASSQGSRFSVNKKGNLQNAMCQNMEGPYYKTAISHKTRAIPQQLYHKMIYLFLGKQ